MLLFLSSGFHVNTSFLLQNVLQNVYSFYKCTVFISSPSEFFAEIITNTPIQYDL